MAAAQLVTFIPGHHTHLNFRLHLFQAFSGHLEMSLAQVLGLLAVERVGDAPQHEHVQLDPSLPLGLLTLLLFL